MVLGSGGSSMAAASQRPMALLAGEMQLSGCRSQVQAQASQQQQLLHFQHHHQSSSQGFAVGLRRPGPAASSPGLLLQRKLAPVLAVGDDELDITAVQELADGSFFFSFGASPPHLGRRVEDLASSRAELVVTPAALHLPQRLPSRFRKHSPIPVLAAGRKRGGKKQEESVPEAADGGAPPVEATRPANAGVQPTRPPSAFVKRSPIPKPTQRRKPSSAPSEAGVDDRTSVSSKDVAHIDLHEVLPSVSAEVSSPKDVVSSATWVQVNGKEQDEQDPAAAASANGRPKFVDNTRRRSSRKAAKSDKGASAQSRDYAPAPAPAQAAPAAVAVHAPVAPSRAPSKFVRRSPIPALSKRSVGAHPAAAPAVAQVASKETTVVVKETVAAKHTVVKESVQAKETVQAGRTTGTSPAVEADVRQDTVVVASVAKAEERATRPKSSFVRRSPISCPQVAKVLRAPPGVPAPQVVEGGAVGPKPEADVDSVKVVDAAAVSSEQKAERKAAPVLPKSSAPTRSRTKQPPAKPVVTQAAATPAVEASKAPVLDSDSESERDDEGPDTSAAATPASLAASTLPELKKIAKARGLKGYSKLKKSELVELLHSGGTS